MICSHGQKIILKEDEDMNVSHAVYSGLGRRKNNEDYATIARTPSGLIGIVADGVGGQAYGELASQLAVQTLISQTASSEVSPDVLKDAILEANTRIVQLQETHPGAQTTIAALWLNAHCAIAMHVGDTRIYQFREGKIVFQSLDHSIAQLAVMNGELQQEEVRTNRNRNMLFRALGDPSVPRISEQLLEVFPGDRFLICTDGFWEKILEPEMLQVAFSTDNAEEWLRQMRVFVEPTAADNNTAVAFILQ